MAILLYRVDDRLIHGQVVVGWGSQLDLDFIAVVDDELAASDWEQDLYGAGLPEDISGRFVSVEEAIDSMSAWRESDERGIVLLRDLTAARQLAEAGALDDQELNLGGLHDVPGRRRVLPYVFLGPEDLNELKRLQKAGVKVSAQDVPSGKAVPLKQLLDG